MRVIQRAIVRTGIGLVYSQGYNPHPQLSLPLPKNVGIASDDELFCVKVQASCAKQSEEACLADSIAAQLPDGFEIVSVEIHNKPVTYRSPEVEYLVKVNLAEKKQEFFSNIELLNEQIRNGREILLERTVNKKGDVKTVDAAKFLKLFELVEEGVMVFCRVLPAGTIRPDEILKLLGMEPDEIGRAVVRKHVHWQIDA